MMLLRVSSTLLRDLLGAIFIYFLARSTCCPFLIGPQSMLYLNILYIACFNYVIYLFFIMSNNLLSLKPVLLAFQVND